MNSSEIAVLGDPEMGQQVRSALSQLGYGCLNEGELELQDEWQVRKWLAKHQPKYIFLCVGVVGQTSTSSFLFTLLGAIHVISGSLGYAHRLRLVSKFMTQEFFLLRRLCELYHFEKHVDYTDLVRDAKEGAPEFAKRCVLFMRDVSAQETKAQSSNRPLERREVRDEVVPQPEGVTEGPAEAVGRDGQGSGPAAKSVLEVQEQAAQKPKAGNVCPQFTASAG